MSFKIYTDIDKAVYKATADISHYSEEKQQQIKAAVEKGCVAMRDQAIRMAPAGEAGNLKAGIKCEMSTDGSASGVVKSQAPHSHLIEFGTTERIAYNNPKRGKRAMVINGDFVRSDIYTGRMTKRPFMRPAYETEKPEFEESIKKLLE